MRRFSIIFFLSYGALFAQSDASGRIGGTGTQLFPVNAQTSTYQTMQNDFQFCKTIPVASGTFTITLVASSAQPATGRCIRIINYGSGVVTVAPGGQLINGSGSNFTIPAGTAAQPTGLWIVSDGTNYVAQPWGGFATLGANTFTGQQIISANGALSTPPLELTGTWVTSGGTTTTTKPQVLIEPTGTTSTGWNTSGTGFGVNAPSGFTGNYADFQLAGVSLARISSNGVTIQNTASGVYYQMYNSAGTHYVEIGSATGFSTQFYQDGTLEATLNNAGNWNISSLTLAGDTGISRLSAGVFAFGSASLSSTTGFLEMTGLATIPVLTANLKTCTASTGVPWRASVSDATAPALGVALTGGGLVFANVHCSLTTGTYIVDGI
jgi:hypothetical protein